MNPLPEHPIDLYRALVSEGLEAITVVDERGIILLENPAAERLTGSGSGVGRCVFDLVHPEDRVRVSEALSRSVVVPESNSRVNYRLRHQDARWVTVESSCHYVDGQTGPLAAIHARDISDVRQLEARLRHAQKLVTLGRMALGVADEFDDAISTIRLHLAAVLEVREGEAPRFGVRAIQKAVADGTALATQLRVFAQTTPVFDERVDVNTVLQEIRLVVAQLWLSVSQSAIHSSVLVDRASLREALTDLVFAFRSAMPPDSVIVLSSANLPVSVAARQLGSRSIDYVVIEVHNTGRGAGSEAGPGAWLFEPAFVKPSSGPIMLSLVILHDVVSYAGGFVEVVSNEHASTTVRVFLPAEIA
jgi:PAS domain S-box-containing protein